MPTTSEPILFFIAFTAAPERWRAHVEGATIVALSGHARGELRAAGIEHHWHLDGAPRLTWATVHADLAAQIAAAEAPLDPAWTNFLVHEAGPEFLLERSVAAWVARVRPERCVLAIRSDDEGEARQFRVVASTLQAAGVAYSHV